MGLSQGISEMVLPVKKVEVAARFYREVVGLTPDETAPKGEGWAWFWAGRPGCAQRVALLDETIFHERVRRRVPHTGEPPHWGQIHFAFHIPRQNLETAVKRVQAHGVAVEGPVHFEWMQASAYYFSDPDGNALEYWSPDPESCPPADLTG